LTAKEHQETIFLLRSLAVKNGYQKATTVILLPGDNGNDSAGRRRAGVAPKNISDKETDMSTPETTYYQDGSITVTNARAVLGAKTFAMANITSVSMGEIPANRKPGIGVALFGLVIAGCASSGGSGAGGGVIFGMLIIGVGIAIAAAVKDQYVVKIGSASGESNALMDKNREYIQKIVKAVNDAIIKRG
jgi:hypothetical protein